MKIISIICLIIFTAQGVCFAVDKVEIKDEADRINYSIGYQIGGDFQQQKWELKPDILTRGINDALKKNKPLLSLEEMNATLVSMKKKLVADQKEAAKKADAAFLAGNVKKEGVISLPSGVQYKVLKSGNGKQPTLQDNVTIKYRVSRADAQNTPADLPVLEPKTYPLKMALPGLQQVLPLMKEGSVWQIILPPGPALGSRGEALEGAGVLVYELELVSVQQGSK